MPLGASKKEEGPLRKVPGRSRSFIHPSTPSIHSFIYGTHVFSRACSVSRLGKYLQLIFSPPKLRPRLVLGSHCSSLSRFICKHTFLRPLYTSAQFLRVGRGECSGEMVAVVMEFIRAAGNRLFLKKQLWKGGWTTHEL